MTPKREVMSESRNAICLDCRCMCECFRWGDDEEPYRCGGCLARIATESRDERLELIREKYALRAESERLAGELEEWKRAATEDMACICGCSDIDHETYDEGASCDHDDHWCLWAPISVGVELREATAQRDAIAKRLEAAEAALRKIERGCSADYVVEAGERADALQLMGIARAYFASGGVEK
jgi:hypothetical protein